MMGNGGSTGDPLNFAQNKMFLLGKILQLDVDSMPSASETVSAQFWGNCSISTGNSSVQDSSSRQEGWAYGLQNPWRSSYLYCADAGQVSWMKSVYALVGWVAMDSSNNEGSTVQDASKRSRGFVLATGLIVNHNQSLAHLTWLRLKCLYVSFLLLVSWWFGMDPHFMMFIMEIIHSGILSHGFLVLTP
ncbi:hypothetical protein GOP47_0028288 [Adiantum capillus-veneris]|nr:hypothetical protein GOP47_0028288 [Adiantum capillus-veneris]